jgi:hypothetical protein
MQSQANPPQKMLHWIITILSGNCPDPPNLTCQGLGTVDQYEYAVYSFNCQAKQQNGQTWVISPNDAGFLNTPNRTLCSCTN